ncbi:hypothetical protein [Nocardia niigatensis]|uniref:hypothetical protein n=1 Tax=Nocardia niigatensis TaxID=209249 RepID=UPI0002FD0B48|nr:hypothetical protein [Nocardia niigatensis]
MTSDELSTQKVKQLLHFAVAHLEDDDLERRIAQGDCIRVHIEGGEGLTFTWGYDPNTGEPLPLIYAQREALLDDGTELPEPERVDDIPDFLPDDIDEL